MTNEEGSALQAGIRSSQAFTVKLRQILLASARGLNATEISQIVGGSTQSVCMVIRAFERRGVEALIQGSKRPKSAANVLGLEACEHLRGVLHESPRNFGKATSIWTLPLAADVGFERGITHRLVSHETIRDAIHRLGMWRK